MKWLTQIYFSQPLLTHHQTIHHPAEFRGIMSVKDVKPVFFLANGALSEGMLCHPKLSSSWEGHSWNYAIPPDKASPGLSSVSSFSGNFPLEQTTSSVKWKSKGKDLISKRNGGAAMLFTPRDFHGSRLLQGHILALLDPVRIDCQADEEIGCR